MSDLTAFRDHCRKMARGELPSSAEDATLWARLADEIDEYLAPSVEVEDLFGEAAVEPEADWVDPGGLRFVLADADGTPIPRGIQNAVDPIGEGRPRQEPERERYVCADGYFGDHPQLGVEQWPCGAPVTDVFHETHVREGL